MSFAVWYEKPPFPEEHLTSGERIFQIGDKWVVTDKLNPTQADIDAVLNAPAPPPDPLEALRAALSADPTLLDKLKAVK